MESPVKVMHRQTVGQESGLLECDRHCTVAYRTFDVKAGLRHQGSVLSPLLFVMVMEVITKELLVGLSWDFIIYR